MHTQPSFPVQKVALSALAVLTLALQVGPVASTSAAASDAQPVAVTSAAASNQVYNKFEALLKKGQLQQAIDYLDANIGKASKYQATIMVLHLENALVKALPGRVDKLAKPEWQTEISKVYRPGDSFQTVANKVKNSSLRTALKDASEMNYRLETAEGFYFPVVRYAAFQKYGNYITADIKTYLDIMTAESEKAVAKDAALLLGYQELANRALAQERFVTMYPSSNRTAQVKNLLHNYKTMTFYGLNNTPLFDYETKTMQANAKKGYTLILQANKGKSSGYLKLLQQFMDVVAEHDYKLTPEVEKFRKVNVPI
ncbi:hypothetical protein SY83_04480 [Paenibacillus swuensis]|uniref:SbsC C-terminal domain-containing protein n=1 Tax=Paenibacillus swuensis TaxID=1178515 RepID=A0A172TF47_9BACL|nr:hypothetical protein [Paenibacillus swuensis]ANE45679.1 hypothetical protein SY83_04480 [Paenibacillus swuensis]